MILDTQVNGPHLTVSAWHRGRVVAQATVLVFAEGRDVAELRARAQVLEDLAAIGAAEAGTLLS